ncbi:SDR family NAD(P)-dependent oxidoreductase [Devosia sp. J2-20]|uniref:SDR family NAD(P)-dependent oxidoreductase n=1 Tax=Devosia sp. J2-20 TaxID=3026161 RepID=UPI00249B6313|nr:SDR family NAD(P)-dependent oxidoreductase [Devosia sp. J2-20]WDR00479.1 SDR family NAD(P)-dependent oxidoreductase [Devosia sp. J2-20]
MGGAQKTVLITGASRGIGFEIARQYAADGYRVLTLSSKEWTREELKPARHFGFDLADTAAVDETADALAEERVDVLINNAGINKIAPFAEIDPAEFRRVQDVNVYAPFRFSQAVIPNMLENGWGRIVNISSIWGMRSKEFRASYSTSKFAIDGMTAAIAVEHSQHDILANSVAPGFIDTEMTRGLLSSSQIDALLSRVPARRLGNVQEVAAFVKWLGSDANTFITGQNIPVDGGFTRA